MRGIRSDVQKKISRLRSRSAERISQRNQMQMNAGEPRSRRRRGDSTTDADGDIDETSAQPSTSGPYAWRDGSSGGHILPAPPAQEAVAYTGPFIGKARALVDYTPSPYDRDALRFKVWDPSCSLYQATTYRLSFSAAI